MGQLEHFLKILALCYKSCLTDADARGEGGQKLAKFCGRLLWMAPYLILIIANNRVLLPANMKNIK